MIKTTFTVVIIAYERKEYIINAVDSILNQSYPQDLVEIIVVKSFQDRYIDKYLDQHKIIHIYCDDKSIGLKFSMGIEKSSGEIICMLEDDDQFSKDKLKEISDVHRNHPEIDVFVNGYDIVDPKGTVQNISYFKKNREFQRRQHLLILGKDDYDPNLFMLLNFYFNNSRFSFTKKTAILLIPFLQRLRLAIDILMPFIWIYENATIAFVPNINNKFMIRSYTHRLEKLLSSNSVNEIEKVIERDNKFLQDYYRLIDYVAEFDVQFSNFLEINALSLEINTDIMSLNRLKLLTDMKEIIRKMLNKTVNEKYKVFIKEVYKSFIPILAMSPLFFFTPIFSRKIIIRILG